MKKLIVTTLATVGVTAVALAQGSINIDSANWDITTPGANATNPSTATTWYNVAGNASGQNGTLVSVAFYYLATANATQSQINALNALDGTASGSTTEFNDLISDGFTEVSDTTLTGNTIGSVTGYVNDGGIAFASNYNIGLSGAPTSTTGWLAAVVTAGPGAFSGDFGILVAANGTGGNPNAVPAGNAGNTAGLDALGENLVLEAPTASPEPTTLAFAGLGGLSLLLFRRRS